MDWTSSLARQREPLGPYDKHRDDGVMSPGPEQKSSTSSKLVFIGVAFLSVVFAVGIGIFVYFMVRPRGEKVGEASLLDAQATLTVSAKNGESLVFRSDASVSLPRLTLDDDDALERQASKQLRSSLLTVRARAPSGSELVATCPVYKGRAVSTTITPGTLSRSGMLNDCLIVLNEPGSWQVRGGVTWSSDLTVKSATLETRLEAARAP